MVFNPLLWTALLNFFTGAMAFGLAMVVLWQSKRHRLNFLFGAFLLALCFHSLLNVLLRVADPLGMDMGRLLRFASMLLVVALISLLLFNLSFVTRRRFWIQLLQGGVLLLAVGGGFYLATGDWFSEPRVTETGHIDYHTASQVEILMVVLVLLIVLSAVLLWRSEKPGARDLFWPTVLLPLGFSAFFIPFLDNVPMLTLVLMLAALLDTRVVLRLQLFDPMAQLNRNLTATNEHLNRTLQELAAANVALAEASQHQNAFLARMSHELRTPMNAIIGFADLLREGVYGEMTEKQKERLGVILRSGNHLLALISDLLDLAKIRGGQMDLHCKAFDSGPALDEVVQMILPLVQNKDLRLNCAYEGAPTVYADPARFQQIMVNLLGNAVKYTAEGAITIRVSVDGTMAHFAISDTGQGIPADQLDSIFDEFRQVELPHNVNDIQHGVGLGLSIVRQLLEMQHGTIHVKSQVGMGSTFTFTLPLQDAAAQ